MERTLQKLDVPDHVLARLPAQIALFYKVFPVAFENGELTVATSTPDNIHQLDGLSAALPDRIKTVPAAPAEILEAIRRSYGLGAETIESMMHEIPMGPASANAVEDILDSDPEASVGRFVNQLLWEAYKDRATDIHIEPAEDDLQIRYRIDGVLSDAQVPKNIRHFKDAINSRLKILANLNIAEKRLPQDGRFKIKAGNSRLDLRVSFLPMMHGEGVVIRILDQNRLFDVKELGLEEGDLKMLDQLIGRPHGIIFVTGPTGSGKTTTLYSCLSRVNHSGSKIITIEDPIEYQLKGVSQIQVNPAIGLTFSHGLRSMLRHDPDIMMVGEVRDIETAEIAVQVALTGHLVFSTLHTNDAASGVTRLLDMGIEPYLICSSVNAFIAQRLVRVLCDKCRRPSKILSQSLEDLGIPAHEAEQAKVFEPAGCEACRMTGYRGRKAIYEFLILDDDIRAMIQQRAGANEIRAAAVKKGMATLRQSGWNMIKLGQTTPAEIIRVTEQEE